MGGRKRLPLEELLAELPHAGVAVRERDGGEEAAVIVGLRERRGGPAAPEHGKIVRVSMGKGTAFRLSKGDLLLRKTSAEHTVTAGLADSREESALLGANLIALRVKPNISTEFLCAYLHGQKNDALFARTQIIPQMLLRCNVPLVRTTDRADAVFRILRLLTEKAERLEKTGTALFDAVLHQEFSDMAGAAAEPDKPAARGADVGRLNDQMRAFLKQMSAFQQELYRTLLAINDGTPVHKLTKQMYGGKKPGDLTAGIQDALGTMSLLEQFGLAESEGGRPIPGRETDFPIEFPTSFGDGGALRDHNGQEILIETYRPTAYIFEENGHAAGEGDDPEL